MGGYLNRVINQFGNSPITTVMAINKAANAFEDVESWREAPIGSFMNMAMMIRK